MTGLLVTSGVLLLLTWIVNGVNLIAISALASTFLFCARKVGYFCRFNSLIVIESIGIALTIIIRILFNKFDLLAILPVIVLRVMFIALCYWDMAMFVYPKEEERKGIKSDD